MILRTIIFSLGITGSAFCMHQKAKLVQESVKVQHPVKNVNIEHCTVYRPNLVKTIIHDVSRPQKGDPNYKVSRTVTRNANNKIEAVYEGSCEINMYHDSIAPQRAYDLFLDFVNNYDLEEKGADEWLAEAEALFKTEEFQPEEGIFAFEDINLQEKQ